MNLRIIHFVSSLQIGGAERFVLDLAITQRDQGVDVIIMSFGGADQPLAVEARSLGLELFLIDKGKLKTYRNLLGLYQNFMQRVMHIHSPAVLSYLAYGLPILKKDKVKLIYTRHGSVPLSRLKWRLLHKWSRLFVDKITFVSQVGLEVFFEQHKWPKSQLVLISNGVLVPEREAAPNDISVVRLGSVGRMVPLKGQRYLLQAVAKLDQELQKNVAVHFFGDGSERGYLEEMAKGLHDDAKVLFHGSVLDREEIFRHIDILVVCSESEGLSLAIMEAMARGIPVIATNVGDSGKLVLPGKTGILFEYGDVGALVEAITNFGNYVSVRQAFGKAAKKHILRNYSMKKTCLEYYKCYGSL